MQAVVVIPILPRIRQFVSFHLRKVSMTERGESSRISSRSIGKAITSFMKLHHGIPSNQHAEIIFFNPIELPSPPTPFLPLSLTPFSPFMDYGN